MRLDRRALTSCLELYTRESLARVFEISLPTLRSYIRGKDPKSPAVARDINRKMETMLQMRIEK